MLVAPGTKLSPAQVKTHKRPAPVKGMNNRLPIDQVGDAGFAHTIENWICRPKGLVLRNGWVQVGTAGNGAAVLSLLTHGVQVFGRADDHWTGATIKNTGGNHTVATGEGVVAPTRYDGAAWWAVEIEGVDPMVLRGACNHGERLFFYGAGSMNLYYLGMDYIGGPVKHIPLASIFDLPGTIVAIGSMSSDAGKGANDQFVVVTSAGQVAIYNGMNPDNVAQWALAGVWKTAKPVGRHPLFQSGTGLNLITAAGVVFLPGMVSSKASEREAATITTALDLPATATAGLESEHGMFTMIDCGPEQYVMDPETKGWSKLTGLGATCWTETTDGLYFGRGDGRVCRYEGFVDNRDVTLPDGGNFIRTLCVDGFSHYNFGGAKTFKKVRLNWQHAMPYRARLEMLADQTELPASWQSNYIDARGWDATLQEVVPGTPLQRPVTSMFGAWRGIGGRGVSGTLLFGAAFNGVEAIYYGHEMEYNFGGRRR